MSELIKTSRPNIRVSLLVTASAMAILGFGCCSASASNADDRPTVWIELGGAWAHLSAGEEKFAPPFVLRTPRPTPETIDPLSVGHPPRSSFDKEGKITFEPNGSNWVFSAGVRYGRSNADKHLRQQSPFLTQPLNAKTVARFPYNFAPFFRNALQFIDTAQKNEETHAVVDFQAGKDVGLGMFDSNTTSVFSVGVRFAQFTSRTNVAFKSDPDAHVKYFQYQSLHIPVGGVYHSYQAMAQARRSFLGVGPSLSWNASTPLMGTPNDAEITIDWGASAAVLFGRQKARVHHQTTAHYHFCRYSAYNPPSTLYHIAPPDKERSRSVVVPNIGGFAGFSFSYATGKVSLGYRADFFFGAMDGGFDTHKSENRGFYGPFATISLGLGG